jgi:hypothetical protein
VRASSNDGTFRRVGKDGGRWWSENWQDENRTGALVLAWTNWPKEKLHTQDGGKTFSCAGLTKWKDQEEPYKFELKLPAKVKHAPAWIRTMEEPTYSSDSDSDSDSDTSDSDAGGSALPAADGAKSILELLKPQADPSSTLGALLGLGTGTPQIKQEPVDGADNSPFMKLLSTVTTPSISLAQQNADDAMMREWLDYEGIAILADAGMQCTQMPPGSCSSGFCVPWSC